MTGVTIRTKRAPPSRAEQFCRWKRSWPGFKGRLSGEIVKVKLERERGAWVYEFRVVIDPQGHWREIAVDAATGAITDAGDD